MKKIYIIAVAVLALAACSGTLSVKSYNEQAVKLFNDFSEKLAAGRETVYEHTLSKEDNLKLLASLNASLDSCMTATKALKYPAEATNFHESLMKLYEYSKDSLFPLLAKTQDFKPESNEWYGVWNEFDARNTRVDELLKVMGANQRALAEKAGAQLR